MATSEAFNVDCMAYMKTLPDNAFNLAVVDVPYGDAGQKAEKREQGAHIVDRGRQKRYAEAYDDCSQIRNVEREREREQGRYNRFGNPGSLFERYKREPDGGNLGGEVRKKIIAWDVAPGEDYFKELFRVSRNQIIWGGNYFSLPPTRCFLVWRKLTISETFTMAMAEYAWTSFNENAKVFECAPQGRPGDDRFHPCLPGETEVYFSGKWKPISEVKIGEENEFGKVSAISTHDAIDMVEITAGGVTVKATWNHPFLVLRGKEIAWVNAEKLRKGDDLICLTRTKQQEKDTCDTERIRTGGSEWSMTLFGKLRTALSRKVCKSITRISTKRIITFPISCLSRPLNTSGYTAVAYVERTENGLNRVKPAENLSLAHKSSGISAEDGYKEVFAKNASSRRSLQTAVCELQTVGSVNLQRKKTKVFNLTIEGIPAFETRIGITHNTQKPVALYKWLLSRYAKPGDRILDTHLGSGSSRIAAWDLGFDFVGCEIDKTYFELEEERFRKHTMQTRMEL